VNQYVTFSHTTLCPHLFLFPLVVNNEFPGQYVRETMLISDPTVVKGYRSVIKTALAVGINFPLSV